MSATEKLDGLMDAKAIVSELGLTRNAAAVLMRQLPKVQIVGIQKNYVRRADVKRYMEEHTIYATSRRRSAA